MDRARDHDDGFAVPDQLISFGIADDFARIGKPSLDGFVLVEIAYILGRADEGCDHRATERRCADSLYLDAIAGFIKSRKVIGDLFPIDDGSIIAGIEAENGSRRRN